MKIELAIRNLGPIPSFKNKKRIARLKGKPALITRPDIQKWMTQCIHSLESQLFCATQIGDGATSTAPFPPSLIASSLPLDDSWTWIPQLTVSAELVDKGCEGATITIERIV